MAKQRRVKFKIRHSNDGKHFTDMQTGGEITFVSETYEDKRSAVKTARSVIKKIQAGLVDIEELDVNGEVVKTYTV